MIYFPMFENAKSFEFSRSKVLNFKPFNLNIKTSVFINKYLQSPSQHHSHTIPPLTHNPKERINKKKGISLGLPDAVSQFTTIQSRTCLLMPEATTATSQYFLFSYK